MNPTFSFYFCEESRKHTPSRINISGDTKENRGANTIISRGA